MSGFSATAAELQAAGALLSQVSEEVHGGLAGLRGQVESLLGGAWRGGAAAGFEAGWQDWLAGLTRAATALDEMGRLLTANGRGYEAADADSLTTIRSVGATV